MSSRKEQKERLRREREERERQAREADRRKKLVGYGAAGALALAALVVVAVLLIAGGNGGEGRASEELLPGGGEVPRGGQTDLRAAARRADCRLDSKRAESREHTAELAERVRYDSNPPTSGRHFQLPAEDGAYSEAPQDEEVVHSLEHGRVVVWFKPGLPEDDRATLKAIFDEEQGYQLLLVPRRRMPFALAASAWNRDPVPNGTGRLLGCPRVTDATWAALRAFIEEHRGNGPEPVP